MEEKYPDKSPEEIIILEKNKEVFNLNKQQQINILKKSGLNENEIEKLKLEKERVDKIIELYKDNSEKIDSYIIESEDIKKEDKSIKPKEKTIKVKETKKEKTDKINKRAYNLNKSQQVKLLESFNLNPKKYKKEEDRVNKILELYNNKPSDIDSSLNAIENYIPTKTEQRSIDLFKMNKKDQVNTLMELGLSSKKIKKLKYEEDRVNMIIKLQDKKKKN